MENFPKERRVTETPGISEARKNAKLRKIIDAEKMGEFRKGLEEILGEKNLKLEILAKVEKEDAETLNKFVYGRMESGEIEEHTANLIFDLIENCSREEWW